MTASVPEILMSWSAFYGDHQWVSGLTRYLHLAAVVVGGGTALAADRLVWRETRSAEGRARVLSALEDAHRVVIPALVVAGLTGVLMFAADAETFLASRAYAAKILAIVVLAANGGVLQRAEQTIRRTGAERAWGWLRLAGAASTVLWFLVLFLGVSLAFAG